MGKIIGFIVGSFVLYNLWVWVIKHITKHQRGRGLWFYIVVSGIVSCLLIFFFPKIIAAIGINKEMFIDSLNILTIATYVTYLAIAGILIYLCHVYKIFDKNFIIRLSVFGILFFGITTGGLVLNFPSYIVYFSIVAFAEEYIKYIFGRSLFAKLHIHYTDLLLFCLISGFAFAFVENGVYARYAVQKINISGIAPKLLAVFQTLVQRGIINVAIHGFFTGIIGWCTLLPVVPKVESKQGKKDRQNEENEMLNVKQVFCNQDSDNTGKDEVKNNNQTPIIKIISGVLLGVIIHAIFNSMISKGIVFIMPIIVLVSYITITYIFYKSDTLFNQQKEEDEQK